MCDSVAERGKGWRGWLDLPPPTNMQPTGPWLDLSWQVSEDMPRVPAFPAAQIERISSLPESPFNATRFAMVVHTGTHVDAPCHFFMDGPTFEEIPLDRLCGPGVVWHLDMELDATIDVAHLEAATPAIRPGDIVALNTGFAEKFGTDDYDRHPSLSTAAAEWLVARKCKLLACDFGTPDMPFNRRPAEGFNWPVHHALLSHGVLVCEHLRGHAALSGQRVEFIFSAINIRSSDGAPARVMARTIAEGAPA